MLKEVFVQLLEIFNNTKYNNDIFFTIHFSAAKHNFIFWSD